jgi:hypothetical protein
MAKGNDSDNIIHLGPVRIRVKGSGNLQIKAYSLDFVRESELPDIAMAINTDRVETILGNFKSQKMQLEIGTSEESEYFTISRITPFTKPVATGYAQ